jgi:hypothetical protein
MWSKTAPFPLRSQAAGAARSQSWSSAWRKAAVSPSASWVLKLKGGWSRMRVIASPSLVPCPIRCTSKPIRSKSVSTRSRVSPSALREGWAGSAS